MSNIKKIGLIMMFGFALTLGMGCAPTIIQVSTPAIQTAENPYYEIQFEPLNRETKVFVSFRLTIINRTDRNLEIDWNKTHYIHNNRSLGIFVFKGIRPQDIKDLTIPPEIIPARGTFSKEISPFRLIGRAPFREGINEPSIKPGPVPTGQSGILLVVRQNGKEIREKLQISITKKVLND